MYRETTHLVISTAMGRRYCDQPIRIATIQDFNCNHEEIWAFLMSKHGKRQWKWVKYIMKLILSPTMCKHVSNHWSVTDQNLQRSTKIVCNQWHGSGLAISPCRFGYPYIISSEKNLTQSSINGMGNLFLGRPCCHKRVFLVVGGRSFSDLDNWRISPFADVSPMISIWVFPKIMGKSQSLWFKSRFSFLKTGSSWVIYI